MLAALSANNKLIPPCSSPKGWRVALVMGIRRLSEFAFTEVTWTPSDSSAVFGMMRWKSTIECEIDWSRLVKLV
jgi:hypothetical protein